MQNKEYVILDEQGGWLVNIVMWNGDTTIWQPPSGTIVKPFNEVDINELPVNPNIDQSSYPSSSTIL